MIYATRCLVTGGKIRWSSYCRASYKTDKEREEQRVADISQNLARYTRESHNCFTAAIEMRNAEQAHSDQGIRHSALVAELVERALILEEEAAQ